MKAKGKGILSALKSKPKKVPDKKGAWIDVQKKALKGCSQCGKKK